NPLSEEKGAGEVDCKYFVPVVVGQLGVRLVDSNSRVVDEDIDAATLFHDLAYDPPAVLRGAHIAQMCSDNRSRAECLNEVTSERVGGFSVAAVAGRDRGALRSEAPADRRADTAGPSRHQCDSTREFAARGRLRADDRNYIDR